MWLPAAGTVSKSLLLLWSLASVISIITAHEDIDITPSDMDRTIFEEGDYRKTCRYRGSGEVSEIQILHNGDVIDQGSGVSIMLDVTDAALTDQGSYLCRVNFTDSTSINATMGALSVVGLDLISAPANQYVVEGEDAQFVCSFNDPDNLYGIALTSIRQGSQIITGISGATMEDEGDYECEVTLVTEAASTQLPIRLHVFTPIAITDRPVNYQKLMGVQEARFTVAFTGRESQGVDVTWFRDGIILYNTPEYQITTTFSEETKTGNTTIYFPEMDRGNAGVFRVVVKTDFGKEDIDLDHRRQEESFQIEVVVPPPNPTGFETALVAEHHVELVWDLPISHPDEDVQNFQLEISFPNGSRAISLVLARTDRTVQVSVFPGVRYDAHLIAMNNDGRGESTLSFETPPAAPYITFFQSRRLNETHFNITISLLYTGGGDTTTFSVYFREQNSIEWSDRPIMIVILDSALALDYHGLVTADDLRGKGPLEFELRVENGLGFMNRTGSGLEISDPPGIPTPPMVSETSDTSVVLDFILPEEGTPPFISIILEFSEPLVMERNFSGTYMPGQTVTKEVGNLSPQTAYSLKARAVNYAGNGPSSDTIKFTTAEARPTSSPGGSTISLEMIIAGAGGVALLVSVAVVACTCCYCCCRRRRRTSKQPKDQVDAESGVGMDKDKEPYEGKSNSHPPSIVNEQFENLEKNHPPAPGNTYIEMKHGGGLPSTASSCSPSSNKRRLERGHHNQASSSTLNSGGSATQDSLIKRPDLLSTGSSDIQLSSLQSSQQGYQTSRDSLGYRRQKVVNPSISSSEATTETAELTTPFLQPQVEDAYSFQSLPFIPEGSSYSSLTYSTDHSQRQYVTNV